MRYNKLLMSVSAALALSACATNSSLDREAANFGEAVKANMSAQAVAPTAKQKEDTFIPANNARRQLAREAYEADEVEEPKDLVTSEQ